MLFKIGFVVNLREEIRVNIYGKVLLWVFIFED